MEMELVSLLFVVVITNSAAAVFGMAKFPTLVVVVVIILLDGYAHVKRWRINGMRTIFVYIFRK